MKIRFLFISIFLALSCSLFATEPPARKALHDAFYNDLATTPEQYEQLFQDAIKEAEKTPAGITKNVNLAWCYYLMSRICGNLGDTKRAEKLGDTAFDYADEARDEVENADTVLIYTNAIAQNCTVKSFWYVMSQGILQESNPLFGRFTKIIRLEELDYYDSSLFYPNLPNREKIRFYSVFGGSPFVLANLNYEKTLEENIKDLLIEQNSLLRTHIESVMLTEIKKNYDVRILEIIGNGKKK